MKPQLYLAWRYLFRGKTQHISFIAMVSCVGIALGVATLIVVISVMNGFDRDLTERLMRFSHHIVIESNDNDKLGQIKNTLDTWEEVESASLFLQTQVFGKFDNLVFPLVVKGIDFTNQPENQEFYRYVTKDKKGEGVFVGEGLRRRFFISEELEFYPLKKQLKLQKSRVRGFFKVGVYDIDNNYLIVSLDEAKELSPNYLLFLGVKIKDPFKASDIKRKIISQLGPAVFATTWIESNQVLFSALELEKFTMFIILSLIILVAAFNIFATLTVKVVEKTKDIGILKSLGFSNKRILAIFSLQGLLLGVVGTLSGSLLGLGLCLALKNYHFIKLPAEIYYIEYLPVAINYPDILLIIFIGIFLSYLFSLIPASRASKLSPSEALRYE
ncbi:MAG: ABC transporter permease [Candidatus Omnitrophica bacterium]|nr:ABC transporter permease [Candidatus Omnitrophota bacterium]